MIVDFQNDDDLMIVDVHLLWVKLRMFVFVGDGWHLVSVLIGDLVDVLVSSVCFWARSLISF